MEVVKLDLKKCNLCKDLARDRLEWRNRIHVADPTQLGQVFDDDDDLIFYEFPISLPSIVRLPSLIPVTLAQVQGVFRFGYICAGEGSDWKGSCIERGGHAKLYVLQ